MVSTVDASLRCVRANLGIAVVPSEIVDPVAQSLRLKVIALTDRWARRRFAICFRSEDSLSPSARLLVARLEKLAAAR